MIEDNQARARADALFASSKQPQTRSEQAWADYRRNQELVLARTARLRSLRLSRDAVQAGPRQNHRRRRTVAR
jgi:hypothetical protein